MNQIIIPDFAGGCLANLLPSVGAALAGKQGSIDLPHTSKYVILLVDGLGWNMVQRFTEHAETMASALTYAQRLTAGLPSTTAVSLSSLGTGLPCGQHGIVGYTFCNPENGKIINALSWQGGPADIEGFRLVPTYYERLNTAGHRCAAVSLEQFEHSALQRTAFTGTTYHGVTEEGNHQEFVNLITQALQSSDVVYAYQRTLDLIGHIHGVGSWQWLDGLGAIDDCIGQVVASLPPDVTLLVTGDHGMVNVGQRDKIVIENHPYLTGNYLVAGEARFRQIYTRTPRELAAQWADVLQDRAVVISRSDAIDAGWFGPQVSDQAAARIGDVIVAMLDSWALITVAFPYEMSMIGMHGSVTPDEIYVPLLMWER